jgi:hypothetical protein
MELSTTRKVTWCSCNMTNCPYCNVSLIGAPIKEEDQHYFNTPGETPHSEEWVTHFRREIGVEVRGVYDGVLYWKCPDCGGTWDR